MKIIAFYLPQFHEIPENNKWWGKGFTEWVNVRNAIPLFNGHNQPRKPLDNNYYDLSNNNTLKWQIDLAKKYGIYGFCVYHYWFHGKLLLEKPMEDLLKDKSLDLPFCFSWANEHWTNGWVSSNSKILMEQNYEGKEDWIAHFNYFLPFFKDKRYMKENNKPILVIYKPQLIDCWKEMKACWDEMAIENGFDGITYIYQSGSFHVLDDERKETFDYGIEFLPGYIDWKLKTNSSIKKDKMKEKLLVFLHRYLHLYVSLDKIRNLFKKKSPVAVTKDYAQEWEKALKLHPDNSKMLPGAFTDWDNTPRHKEKGKVFLDATPEKFEYYLTKQIHHAKQDYKKDVLFMFAWNEWGEGGYLEPDELHKHKMLEGVKKALENNGEFPVSNDSNITLNIE